MFSTNLYETNDLWISVQIAKRCIYNNQKMSEIQRRFHLFLSWHSSRTFNSNFQKMSKLNTIEWGTTKFLKRRFFKKFGNLWWSRFSMQLFWDVSRTIRVSSNNATKIEIYWDIRLISSRSIKLTN